MLLTIKKKVVSRFAYLEVSSQRFANHLSNQHSQIICFVSVILLFGDIKAKSYEQRPNRVKRRFLKKYTFNRTKCRRNRQTRKLKRVLRKLVQAGMERRENRREKKATPSTSIKFSNKFILIRASRAKRWEL